MSASTETSTPLVLLDLGLCKACGICIDLCPDEVFDRDGRGYPVLARLEDCRQCLLCELHCPDFAIEVRRRERRGKSKPGAAGEPAETTPTLSREDLIAATSDVQSPNEACDHSGEV
jgi:2-oxoglutarate ferredoxin oxidoreductase subunit delta